MVFILWNKSHGVFDINLRYSFLVLQVLILLLEIKEERVKSGVNEGNLGHYQLIDVSTVFRSNI